MIRLIVARNVLSLRDEHFAREKNETAKNKALAAAAGTSLSQIQRILSRTLGTSIDIIESLATVFGLRPQDLLTPYFSDKHDPRGRSAGMIHERERPADQTLQRR